MKRQRIKIVKTTIQLGYNSTENQIKLQTWGVNRTLNTTKVEKETTKNVLSHLGQQVSRFGEATEKVIEGYKNELQKIWLNGQSQLVNATF